MRINFTISIDFLKDLEKKDISKSYHPVSERLSHEFQRNNVNLDKDKNAIFVEHPDQRWRVIDGIGVQVRAFTIQRENDRLGVHQRTTSGRSDVLWDYQIFDVGRLDPTRHYGWERSGITDHLQSSDEEKKEKWQKIRKKWDFFIRPRRGYVGLAQRRQIWDLMDKNNLHRENIKRKKNLRTIFGIGCGLSLLYTIAVPFLSSQSGLSIPCSQIVSAVAFFAALALAGVVSISLKSMELEVKQNEGTMEELHNEVKHLLSQMPTEIPTAQEIHKWHQEEIVDISERVLKEMSLDERDILPFSEELKDKNPPDVTGILLADGAASQPPKILEDARDIEKSHLNSVAGRGRYLLYGAYKFQFIYPTKNLLAVYGCFYDFILQEENSASTAEYFYRNVVNLSSKAVRWNSDYIEDHKIEAIIFHLSVSSGDHIQIALTDWKYAEDINKRIAARSKLKTEEDRRLHQEEIEREGSARPEAAPPMGEEEYVDLVESAECQVPATLGQVVISFIRNQLREKYEPRHEE